MHFTLTTVKSRRIPANTSKSAMKQPEERQFKLVYKSAENNAEKAQQAMFGLNYSEDQLILQTAVRETCNSNLGKE